MLADDNLQVGSKVLSINLLIMSQQQISKLLYQEYTAWQKSTVHRMNALKFFLEE